MKTNENSELSRIHPTSSTERIFDCYLFINPLGKQCYKCEQEVMKFIKRTPHKVHVHFLPFHNFKSVTQYMKNNQLNVKNIDLRNEIYTKIYDASLSYKAALLQGKKLGRAFLMELQTQLHLLHKEYTPELLQEIIQIIGLDEKMFYEDKASKLVHQEYEKDQQIAQEMMVETNPSLVIFDNLNQQYGVILHQNINADIIEHVCENLHHDIGVCPKKTQRHQTCCVIKMVH
ncbi:DsbA family protein [uncultured Granulicatella sp.]|uniref:DsbA family protein n=1 Tax=uncultured Granulicatella sp. TaxID=316089 RepID=UPI0028EF73A1|nr:DsbA family protein [uncultured Granulicatella sp.]